MAPEQAERQGKDVGPAADVYALGAILYECLTGRPPFKAATPLDTLLQVVERRAGAAARSCSRKVPRDLETICLKCLQKEPAQALRHAPATWPTTCAASCAGEPIQARPVGAARAGVAVGAQPPAAHGMWVAYAVFGGMCSCSGALRLGFPGLDVMLPALLAMPAVLAVLRVVVGAEARAALLAFVGLAVPALLAWQFLPMPRLPHRRPATARADRGAELPGQPAPGASAGRPWPAGG